MTSRFGIAGKATRQRLVYAGISLLLVIAARSLLSLLLLRHGFRALSDDDYSRVVIAQLFAEQPTFDPSKTSWLPFPFWLYGTCMACFGKSLAVAQATGFLVGVCSSVVLWFAARVLGISRFASVLGVLIAIALPYSAWLGLAMTPDVFSAALASFSCATLARRHFTLRLLGAIALAMATLSRYEAWPIAVLWSAYTAVDAARLRRWRLAGLAACTLLAPALWMLHGVTAHGSALFFVERVAHYQRALCAARPSSAVQLLGTPWRLVADAPEIWILLLAAFLSRGARIWHRRWTRPLCAMSGAVLLVWLGDWHGGTATHHASRTLLAPWFMLAALAAAALWSRDRRVPRTRRARFLLTTIGAIALTTFLVRPTISSTEPPQDRSEEVRFGLMASARLPIGARLAIATPGYGYFAVEAAFARPKSAQIINRHDPRWPERDPLRSSDDTRRTLLALQTDWIVADRKYEQILSDIADVLDRGPTLLFAESR